MIASRPRKNRRRLDPDQRAAHAVRAMILLAAITLAAPGCTREEPTVKTSPRAREELQPTEGWAEPKGASSPDSDADNDEVYLEPLVVPPLPTQPKPPPSNKQPPAKETAQPPVQQAKASPSTRTESPTPGKQQTAPKTKPRKIAPADSDSVTLTDGTVLHLKKWGQTYDAYEWKPPIRIDDPSVKTLVRTGEAINHPFVVDPETGSFYWAQASGTVDFPFQIWRMDPNRSRPELIAGGMSNDSRGISIDFQQKKAYWSDYFNNNSKAGIYEAAFKGRRVEPLSITGRGDAPAVSTAVDERTGDVYYDFGYAIIRIDFESKKESRVLHLPLDTPGGGVRRIYVFGQRNELFFSTLALGTTTWWQCRLDGTDVKKLFEIRATAEGGDQIAVDWSTKKIYWIAGDKARRGNFDGTQREDLVQRHQRIRISHIAIDAKRGFLYVADRVYHGRSDVLSIHRVPLRPPLEPHVKPAPPLVTAVEPARQHAGGEISLSGRGFTGTTHVTFVETGTGRNIDAEFREQSDGKLSVVVPELNDASKTPSIVVRANGALTVTLPLNLHVITWDYPNDRPSSYFKRFESDPALPYWVTHGFGTVEGCTVYVAEPDANLGTGVRGGNTVFLKNGAWLNYWQFRDCVIYHEPFVSLYSPSQGQSLTKTSETSYPRLIPVSAIRPSFLAKPFEYEPSKKNDN